MLDVPVETEKKLSYWKSLLEVSAARTKAAPLSVRVPLTWSWFANLPILWNRIRNHKRMPPFTVNKTVTWSKDNRGTKGTHTQLMKRREALETQAIAIQKQSLECWFDNDHCYFPSHRVRWDQENRGSWIHPMANCADISHFASYRFGFNFKSTSLVQTKCSSRVTLN